MGIQIGTTLEVLEVEGISAIIIKILSMHPQTISLLGICPQQHWPLCTPVQGEVVTTMILVIAKHWKQLIIH